jgi:hypothetical protein
MVWAVHRSVLYISGLNNEQLFWTTFGKKDAPIMVRDLIRSGFKPLGFSDC